MNDIFLSLRKLQKFLGAEVCKCIIISGVSGLLWFGIEYFFTFILQGFLLTLGLLSNDKVIFISWFPMTTEGAVGLLILYGVLRSFIFMLKQHYANLSQLTFTCTMRERIFSFGLKHSEFSSTKETLSLFTDITTQSGVVMNSVASLCCTGISAIFFLIAGLYLAPYEMIIGVLGLSVFLLPLRTVTKSVNRHGVGLIDEWSNISERLLRGLKNSFFLKIYRQVDTEVNQGISTLEIYKKHWRSYSLVAAFASTFPIFLGICVLSAITFLSLTYIKTEPMKLLSFFYIFIRLSQSASEMSGTLAAVKFNLPGFKFLYTWSTKLESISRSTPGTPYPFPFGPVFIEMKNLGFSFDDKNLFRGIDVKVGPSEVLLVKGPSGSGKSTLLSIIVGLLDPTEGELLVNSISSREAKYNFQNILAYVGPEPYLIHGSIRENLIYGSNITISDEEIWQSLKVVDLIDLVKKQPLQLDEVLLDLAQISTGQKQRISIARALLRKPTLLILDEATANIDSGTEKIILDNLKNLMNNCTNIIVTHKPSFDHLADFIINLGESENFKDDLC